MKKDTTQTVWQRKLRSFPRAEKIVVTRPFPWLVALLIAVIVLGSTAIATQAATVSRTNSNTGSADNSAITRAATFTTDDFVAGSIISDVNVAVTFDKIDGDCFTHDGGWPFNREIYAFLTSPLSTQVALIEDNLNNSGSGAGSTYTSSSAYGGKVTVQFDDSASTIVGGAAPTSGTFRPVQPLSGFAGQSPLGTWTLTIGDSGSSDPLCFYEYTLTIDADQPPLVEDQSFNVAENSTNGAVVGTVVASDPDSGDKLTYAITAGNSAGIFTVDSSTGTITVADGSQLDFETPPTSYNLTVEVIDSSLLSDTATITINVTDANDAPTGITLDDNSVAENQVTGTAVGSFATADVDAGASHTYSLVTGAGDADNGVFTIDGSVLKTNAVFDYEAKSSYSIRVQSDDGNGGTVAAQFTITITDANDAPTEITLDDDSVAENQVTGTAVGSFATTDPDTGDTHIYTLVAGAGDADNGVFTIDGSTLKTNAIFDFETKFSYSIRVQSDDGNGGTVAAQFTIAINDANDAPVVANPIPDQNATEDAPFSFTFAADTFADEDAGDSLSYTAQLAGGGALPGWLSFDGGTRAFSGTPANDDVGTVTVEVIAKDSSNASASDTFNLTVLNSNDAPTGIILDDDSVAENQTIGTAVGSFATTDVDAGDTHTYTLVAGAGDADNGFFTIDGSTLKTNAVFDYEAKSSYSIRVQSDDGNGGTVATPFTITIADANDPPVATDSVGVTDEDSLLIVPASGVLSNDTDADAGDSFDVTDFDAISAHGAAVSVQPDGSYTYDPTAAVALQVLRATDTLVDTFNYTIRDSGGLTDSAVVRITVSGINDAPVAADDTAATQPETPVTLAVLGNDTDPENDSLSVSLVTQGSSGTVINNGDGTVTYTPNAGFSGSDLFTYTVSDGQGGSNSAAVSVSVARYQVFLPLVVNNFVSAPDLVVTSVRAGSDDVEVVVKNQGNAATNDAFWVDFYVNPSPLPGGANQLWQDLSAEGIAWGVTVSLAPGETLALTYSPSAGAPNLYYSPAHSSFSGGLPAGTPIYAQVDSAHVNTVYGGVLESHELTGAPYNNVSSRAMANNFSLPPSAASSLLATSIPLSLPSRPDVTGRR